ncbi:sugar transporter [Notoacmeibacter marinus]|uniref:TRAP transporter small permease protein n=1 Tax=Notoacmeibacter marinus TaxID=1876515 RepID=A0A231UXY3_9HYPH|nr:TRAP transporter small permease subunit [Notoacmeibacter marinus]OXT00744.1 sugar transporter [Notoacmeibacter marinus]
MALLIGLSSIIDAITRFIGKAVSWLVLVAVLVSAYNATVRYLGGSVPDWVPIPRASNALLELQWYLYGAVFLMAAAWTLQDNEHIRIDLVSNRLSRRTRDIIDLCGHLLALLPFAGLLIWLAWPWFWRSYNSGEISGNANGLILWPAKLILLVGFIMLFAQGVSEAIKRLAVLRGDMEDPHLDDSDLPPAVAEMEKGGGLNDDDDIGGSRP